MSYINIDISKSDVMNELNTSDLIAELQERKAAVPRSFYNDIDQDHIDLIGDLEHKFREQGKYPQATKLQEIKEVIAGILDA